MPIVDRIIHKAIQKSLGLQRVNTSKLDWIAGAPNLTLTSLYFPTGVYAPRSFEIPTPKEGR